MNRSVVVVHPGVQHSGQLAADLHDVGRLQYLATRLQVGDAPGWPWRLRSLERPLDRRRAPGLPDSRIRRIGVAGEVLHRVSARLLSPRVSGRIDELSAARFNARVLRGLDDSVRAVVGTDTASLELFTRLERARPGIARVLDVSHPLAVAVQPLIRADAADLGLDIRDYDDYRAGEPVDQLEEISSAHVVLVASTFSASTLVDAGVDAERICVVPYGLRAADIAALDSPRPERRPEFQLLALGAMSERKGMTVLLRAMEDLDRAGVPVRLTLAGRPAGTYQLPERLPSNTSYLGSPPAAEVARLYAEADELVLPSMCEGFGRTILEALAAGASVITTERTGGPDVLREAPNAPVTILPVAERRTLGALIEEHVRDRDRVVRPAEARQAAQTFSAGRYMERLARAIDKATGFVARGADFG